MSRKIRARWWLVTVLLIVLVCSTLLLNAAKQAVLSASTTLPAPAAAAAAAASSPVPAKHVTKSLTELGKMDDINSHVLFLNSVPDSGNEVLVLLLQKIQGINSFRHFRLKGQRKYLTYQQQEEVVDQAFELFRNNAVPVSFDRPIYFTNFTSFGRQSPTYINLIREPADKLLSRSTYSSDKDAYKKCLKNDKIKCTFRTDDLTIPYFCGHDPKCTLLNNEWALKTAKYNVEKYYPVVGVLDEFNATLEILEQKIPYYFKGVVDIYKKQLLYTFNHKRKINISKSVRKRLKKSLIKEYEFYEWIKSRLFEQMQMVLGEHAH